MVGTGVRRRDWHPPEATGKMSPLPWGDRPESGSPASLIASRQPGSQPSEARGGENVPASAAGGVRGKKHSIHVINGTLFSPGAGRERGSSPLVQRKERGPCGERNLLQLSEGNPRRTGWVHRKENGLCQPTFHFKSRSLKTRASLLSFCVS